MVSLYYRKGDYMKIESVNKDNFDSVVKKSSIPVLVDFNASWCGPCKMLTPILEEVSKEHSNFKIVSINVDDEMSLAEKYEVSAIPCLIVFKDGKEVSRSVGLRGKEDIISMMEE